MSKYTTVLLDIDETILDFNAAESAALRSALTSFELPVSDEIVATYHVINDGLWKDFELGLVTKDELKVLRFERTLKKCGIDFDAHILQKRYTDMLSQQGILLDGALDFLSELSERYDVNAITNGISYVQKGRFEKAQINRFFNKVFISEDVGFGKPNIKYFEYVLERIEEKDKSKIIVVGDSPTSDIRGGINAGLDTCLFARKEITLPDDVKPTYTAKTYGEILEMIK